MRSSSERGWSRRTRERERSGAVTSKDGFSVVAPTKSTRPFEGRQEGVLLGLVEAVDLVYEEDRAAIFVLEALSGGVQSTRRSLTPLVTALK